MAQGKTTGSRKINNNLANKRVPGQSHFSLQLASPERGNYNSSYLVFYSSLRIFLIALGVVSEYLKPMKFIRIVLQQMADC